MIRLTAEEIGQGSGGRVVYGNPKESAITPCLDSRQAGTDGIMFCLRGEKTDGHRYIPSAAEQGCRIFAVEEEYMDLMYEEQKEKVKDCTFIAMNNVERGLQKLAAWYIENRLNLKKTVAVTGSVGKTSTRDMIYAALSTEYVTGKNMKNFNSQVGLPITILSFDETMEAAVLEMGMDGFGQIHQLVSIVHPDVAVITNIGISHMERLGSQQGILKAKLEVTDYFNEDNVLVINGNDHRLNNNENFADKKYRVIPSGSLKDKITEGFSVKNLKDMGVQGISFTLYDREQEIPVRLQTPGAHNSVNAALAVDAARICGAVPVKCAKALERAERTGNRLRLKEGRGIRIIDDSYNAAPVSTKSAICTLMNSQADRRVAVLGDMNELGADSSKEHGETGAFAAEKAVDLIVAVGEKAKDLAEGAREYCRNHDSDTEVLYFNSREDIYPEIDNIFRKGDLILLKASRSLELEKLSDRILKG